ncbi:hypothetical protein SVA_2850 [Sulfurifustis variabilis]|uniref:Putative zinc-finger domain-containing protein n=1 Tax=Sulfurifustis variabilis TaxID=1675686 RepID=A0A1B4V7B3_9GAMM|nr:zf-HC2 domain-containing protein [Sulfurifustis variabilis]BAU49398.1 hypothetical protein SVA_2850 [Sulfurifustis variabilis]
MTAAACRAPLDWPTLIAYRLGELDPDTEARIEEHYLGCAECSRRLDELSALAEGVRAVARASGVTAVVNEPFVQRLTERGLKVRAYRVPQNGSVNCTIAPEDDFVVARLEAPLAGVTRLDLVNVGADGRTEMRLEDIPFIAETGHVIVSTRVATLRALPATTLRMRLLAVEGNGERALGEYTFHHTPQKPTEGPA